MEEKTKTPQSREALADFLAELARQVRRGEVSWEGATMALPPVGDLTVEVKAKSSGLKLKLTLAFASPPTTLAPAAATRVADFKAVKKRLAAVFAQLKRLAAAGDFPPPSLVAEFQELSTQFAAWAEPEWRPEVAKYLEHVHNLVLAVDLRELQMWQHELADLQLSMDQCHREYK